MDYFSYPGEQVNDLAYSSDGNMIAHAISDGSVWIRRATNGIVIARVKVSDDDLLRVTFSPQDSYLAIGSDDGIVNLLYIEVMRGIPIKFSHWLVMHHRGWVDDLAFSPDERSLAVAAHHSELAIWQFPQGELVSNFIDDVTDHPNSVAFFRWKVFCDGC